MIYVVGTIEGHLLFLGKSFEQYVSFIDIESFGAITPV